MRFCTRCGNTIESGHSFCSACGLQQPESPRPVFPWRRWAIILLSVFLLIGTTQVLYNRLVLTPNTVPGDTRQKTEEPLAGVVYDKFIQDTWEYGGGIMDEYIAYNAEGNRVTIYRDQDTGMVRGFTASLPAATEIILSPAEARHLAEQAARQLPFFTDPTLQLKEEILVDHGPETERFYSFHWLAEDPRSGALLLREIQVGVNPENGGIIYLLSEDGGEVTVSTQPTLPKEVVRSLAFPGIEGYFQQPQAVEEVLYVSTEHGGQRLIWMVIFEESAQDAWARRAYVDVDAHTGKILNVVY